VPLWFIDAALAAQIIVEFEVRVNRTVVDYEHQTLLTVQNSQPTPGCGRSSSWLGLAGFFDPEIILTRIFHKLVRALTCLLINKKDFAQSGV
jgi:phage I-like protein